MDAARKSYSLTHRAWWARFDGQFFIFLPLYLYSHCSTELCSRGGFGSLVLLDKPFVTVEKEIPETALASLQAQTKRGGSISKTWNFAKVGGMLGVGHSHPTPPGTVLQFRQGLEGENLKKNVRTIRHR